MTPDELTVVLLTYDEAPNLARVLDALRWASRVLILDSGSTDGTQAIAAAYANVELRQRAFDSHAVQWNAALDLAATDWVLTLDADYVLPAGFADELATIAATGEDVHFARFRYCVAGRPLRASLLPPRAVLFRRSRARYVDDGHTQRLAFTGPSRQLRLAIDHDDRKDLSRWLRNQIKYARLEADKLATTEVGALGWPDRIRRWIVVAPGLVFLHSLFVRGVGLDGWRGLNYATQRLVAELMLSLFVLERRLESPPERKG